MSFYKPRQSQQVHECSERVQSGNEAEPNTMHAAKSRNIGAQSHTNANKRLIIAVKSRMIAPLNGSTVVQGCNIGEKSRIVGVQNSCDGERNCDAPPKFEAIVFSENPETLPIPLE